MINELYLAITVDTESPQTPLLIRGDIHNLTWMARKHKLGVPQIIKILESFGIRATFFLNVYEKCVWGEKLLKEIAKAILESGNDVELHTHPAWCFDRTRLHMWQYSLAEQMEILKVGIELLKRWTGKYPIAHRAGAYGVNKKTFVALKQAGIRVDSSNFYEHPNCKVIWTINEVIERDGIIEFPVTGFFRNVRYQVGPIQFRKNRRFIKTDIDWASLDELKKFIEDVKGNGVRIMNLFMHSYSLVKWNDSLTEFRPDREKIDKFARILEFVTAKGNVEVVTMRAFYEQYTESPWLFQDTNYVPVFESRRSLGELARKVIMRSLT